MVFRSPRVLNRAQKRHALFQFGWLVSACVACSGAMVVSRSVLVDVAAMLALGVAVVVTPLVQPPGGAAREGSPAGGRVCGGGSSTSEAGRGIFVLLETWQSGRLHRP